MPGYFGALTMILLVVMVISRVLLLKRNGVEAMNFGKTDKSDFLILPFAIFYFYLVFDAAFGGPSLSSHLFFQSQAVAWIGVIACLAGLLLLLWSLISFGRSFRVGIDTNRPDKLITSGVFGYSRNPIYVAFLLVLSGQFLIFPNWILLIYLLAATWLINRQIVREEAYLIEHYGRQYTDYRQRVRRYL